MFSHSLTYYNLLPLTQFEDADSATPGPRKESGNISAITHQLVGPQLKPKQPTYSHIQTAVNHDAPLCASQLSPKLASRAATRIKNTSMPAVPASINGRRPTLSMNWMAGMTETTKRQPITPDARSEVVLFVRPIDVKIVGA